MDRDVEQAALKAMMEALGADPADGSPAPAERPTEGLLLGAFVRGGLTDLDVTLVLLALMARIEGRPLVTGGELARSATPDAATRLAALGRLADAAPLVARGFLVPETLPALPGQAETVRFTASEHVFRLACEVFGLPLPEEPEPPTGSYRNNLEMLADLRCLSLAYRRRAARLFHLDPWTGTGLEVLDETHAVLRHAREQADRVTARMAETPNDETFPLQHLRVRQGLDLDSLVILVTVLYHEIVDGVGAVDAVDLVRLVSESESDLLRRRQLLRPLARKGLLRLEGGYDGKDTTADASLPNSVVDALLGGAGVIGADEKLDFHRYLRSLESSESFFLDMDGNPGPD